MTSTSLLSPSALRMDDLRARIDVALSAAAQDDAVERWSSDSPAGRRLLSLAAQARRAAAALGADGGVPLVAGPGVVVLRELAAAAHLLDEAVEGATSAPRLLEVA
jgi:16S rRNA C1402 (ribose-2'-O) methylase RsmI